MTTQPCTIWLPECALVSPAGIAAIERALADWSDTWLAQSLLEASGSWRQRVGPLPEWSVELAPGLALCCSPEDHVSLASALFGRELSEKNLRTDQDKALIASLVDQALGDLGKALLALCPGKPDGEDALADYALDLGLADQPACITLAATREWLVSLAQAQAAPARRRAALDDQDGLFDQQDVTVGAILGHSRLTLAEVQDLAVGDVIVLDEAMSRPLDITLNGAPVASEAASVELAHNTHSLKLSKAPHQW